MIDRTTLLEKLFNEGNYSIIGVQEGRTMGDQLISGLFFDMYVAGAAANVSYGSQLWVHRELPHKVQSTIVASSRTIVVTMKIQDRARVLHCISAHAPHSGRPEEACAFWYEMLALVKNLESRFKASEFLLLVDANAKVGSVMSTSIGQCYPEAESECGQMFRHFLEAAGLVATSTYFPIEFTWTGSRGHRSQIDYVVSSQALHDNIIECFADDGVDLAPSVRDDHRLVAVTIDTAFLGMREREPTCKPRFNFDKDGLLDNKKCDYFQQLMWNFDLPKEGDINDRVLALCNHIKTSEYLAFGRAPKRPRQNWMSHSTWNVVQLHAPLRRLSYSCYNGIKHAVLGLYFYT